MMNLADYLTRIEYSGPVAPTLDCLNAIHRHHLLHVPYENLDVQLQREVDQDLERIFEKIVVRHRGGWCYEMNGLLAWVLEEIGFDVMRMVGSVMRASLGDATLGNHLVLAVQLDRPYLADVGLANGLIEPALLESGTFKQGHREFQLESLGDGHWRFHNFEGALPSNFDFQQAAADEELLARQCIELQTNPESKFRQNLICARSTNAGVDFLLGRLLMTYSGLELTKRLLATEAEFSETLDALFGIRDYEMARLWESVVARHSEIFGEANVAEIDLNQS